MVVQYLLAYGKQQMGLTEAGVSVDKERVVDLARIVCDGDGDGVGKLV